MKKLILILPALLAAVLMTSCVEDGYAYHDDGPAYSGSNSVDFYYTSGRPYSRSYGPLEYRDDRYVAALKLEGGQARLFYLVRAVTPGTYVVPPPQLEDMYRPQLRAVGKTPFDTIKVVPP